MRDILKGDDPQIAAIVAVIARLAPDILILTDVDFDHDGLALAALAQRFDTPYPHRFARMPNAGRASGLDIDGNGRTGEARDAWGYGRFAGDGGLAVLSRYPFDLAGFTDHSGRLWRDLPDAVLPVVEGRPFPSQAVWDALPVSSTAHWDLPVVLPDGVLHLLTFSATPPVFDGPEDMNGLRARDELRLWAHVLDGVFGPAPASFVVAGNSNLDPSAGDGDRAAMAEFLARGDVQDPHAGQPNADWDQGGPGRLRVSYLLPSRDWTIAGAGTFWPAPDDADAVLLGEGGSAAGPHRLVWLDISR
ncbi:endonuclease/exonuclease/phosphatase family protein [Yoonia sp.]|uniref:endonuclease/exonuclease/phosphatase family protein n=1 Tax=Yoonia sp. TaxID=2212373 RepID=UPI002FDB96BA